MDANQNQDNGSANAHSNVPAHDSGQQQYQQVYGNPGQFPVQNNGMLVSNVAPSPFPHSPQPGHVGMDGLRGNGFQGLRAQDFAQFNPQYQTYTNLAVPYSPNLPPQQWGQPQIAGSHNPLPSPGPMPQAPPNAGYPQQLSPNPSYNYIQGYPPQFPGYTYAPPPPFLQGYGNQNILYHGPPSPNIYSGQANYDPRNYQHHAAMDIEHDNGAAPQDVSMAGTVQDGMGVEPLAPGPAAHAGSVDPRSMHMRPPQPSGNSINPPPLQSSSHPPPLQSSSRAPGPAAHAGSVDPRSMHIRPPQPSGNSINPPPLQSSLRPLSSSNPPINSQASTQSIEVGSLPEDSPAAPVKPNKMSDAKWATHLEKENAYDPESTGWTEGVIRRITIQMKGRGSADVAIQARRYKGQLRAFQMLGEVASDMPIFASGTTLPNRLPSFGNSRPPLAGQMSIAHQSSPFPPPPPPGSDTMTSSSHPTTSVTQSKPSRLPVVNVPTLGVIPPSPEKKQSGSAKGPIAPQPLTTANGPRRSHLDHTNTDFSLPSPVSRNPSPIPNSSKASSDAGLNVEPPSASTQMLFPRRTSFNAVNNQSTGTYSGGSTGDPFLLGSIRESDSNDVASVGDGQMRDTLHTNGGESGTSTPSVSSRSLFATAGRHPKDFTELVEAGLAEVNEMARKAVALLAPTLEFTPQQYKKALKAKIVDGISSPGKVNPYTQFLRVERHERLMAGVVDDAGQDQLSPDKKKWHKDASARYQVRIDKARTDAGKNGNKASEEDGMMLLREELLLQIEELKLPSETITPKARQIAVNNFTSALKRLLLQAEDCGIHCYAVFAGDLASDGAESMGIITSGSLPDRKDFLKVQFNIPDTSVMERLSHRVRTHLAEVRAAQAQTTASENDNTMQVNVAVPDEATLSGSAICDGVMAGVSWAVNIALNTPGGLAYKESKRRILAGDAEPKSTMATRVEQCARLNMLNTLLCAVCDPAILLKPRGYAKYTADDRNAFAIIALGLTKEARRAPVPWAGLGEALFKAGARLVGYPLSCPPPCNLKKMEGPISKALLRFSAGLSPNNYLKLSNATLRIEVLTGEEIEASEVTNSVIFADDVSKAPLVDGQEIALVPIVLHNTSSAAPAPSRAGTVLSTTSHAEDEDHPMPTLQRPQNPATSTSQQRSESPPVQSLKRLSPGAPEVDDYPQPKFKRRLPSLVRDPKPSRHSTKGPQAGTTKEPPSASAQASSGSVSIASKMKAKVPGKSGAKSQLKAGIPTQTPIVLPTTYFFDKNNMNEVEKVTSVAVPDFPNVLGKNRPKGTKLGDGAASMAIAGAEFADSDWESTGLPEGIYHNYEEESNAPNTTPHRQSSSVVPETPSQSVSSPFALRGPAPRTSGTVSNSYAGQDYSHASNDDYDQLDDSFGLPSMEGSAEILDPNWAKDYSRMDVDDDDMSADDEEFVDAE